MVLLLFLLAATPDSWMWQLFPPEERWWVVEQERRTEERVAEKQTLLQELGWYLGEVDGIYGPLTEQAVDEFIDVADVERDELLGALRDEDAPVPPAVVVESPIAGHWIRLAECESGNWLSGGGFESGSARWQWGHPDVPLPPWGTTLHHGGLQFHPQTWSWVAPMVGLGHIEYAYEATPEQQVRVAEKVQELQGWGAWPRCSRLVGLR